MIYLIIYISEAVPHNQIELIQLNDWPTAFVEQFDLLSWLLWLNWSICYRADCLNLIRRISEQQYQTKPKIYQEQWMAWLNNISGPSSQFYKKNKTEQTNLIKQTEPNQHSFIMIDGDEDKEPNQHEVIFENFLRSWDTSIRNPNSFMKSSD